MKPLKRVTDLLSSAKPCNGYWQAQCPAHEDKRASLSVKEGEDGRVLLNCHAGCTKDKIVAALGLSMADLFEPSSVSMGPGRRQAGAAIAYNYTDEQGELLFQVRRSIEPKNFKQRRPDGKGRWVWNLAGVRRVLYRLPEVLDIAAAGGTIFVVEGEKDADALAKHGLTATTNNGGAGKWLPEFSDSLAGAHVVVLPDNDEIGERHAQIVAQSCFKTAGSVRIVHLPGLPPKGDVSDWLMAGGTKEDLLDLVQATRLWNTEQATKAQSIDDALPAIGDAIPDFDGPPDPLAAALRPVKSLLSDLIPGCIRPWILDSVERLSCPIEFMAIPAVVALGSVIGRQIGIRPKRFDDGWLEYPNLWGAIVGRPGALKTPASSEALKPLTRLEFEEGERHAQELQLHKVEAILRDFEIKRAQSDLKGKSVTGAQKRELAETICALDEQREPPRRRWILNDATVEKVGELLRDNPIGLLMNRDELTGFFRVLEKPGHETDRAFYLEAWNGRGGFTYDRIGRGTVIIPSVCISILGTIQPGPLIQYLREATQEGNNDGLASRFQLLVWPDPVAYQIVDRYGDRGARAATWDVFKRLASVDLRGVGAVQDDDNGPNYLRYADDAQQLFYSWLADLEHRLQACEHPLLETHLSKFRKLVPALSLIFHLVEEGCGPVTIEALSYAIRWAEVLESHALRIYGAVSEGGSESAMALAKKLKRDLSNPFTARDVQRHQWSKLTTQKEIEAAITYLEDHNWLKTVRVSTGGRPSTSIYIHPDVRAAPDETDTRGPNPVQESLLWEDLVPKAEVL